MILAVVPLKVVSEILGHVSISITGHVYARVSPDVSAQRGRWRPWAQPSRNAGRKWWSSSPGRPEAAPVNGPELPRKRPLACTFASVGLTGFEPATPYPRLAARQIERAPTCVGVQIGPVSCMALWPVVTIWSPLLASPRPQITRVGGRRVQGRRSRSDGVSRP